MVATPHPPSAVTLGDAFTPIGSALPAPLELGAAVSARIGVPLRRDNAGRCLPIALPLALGLRVGERVLIEADCGDVTTAVVSLGPDAQLHAAITTDLDGDACRATVRRCRS